MREVGNRIDILNQNGTQVAYKRIVEIVIGSMAATEDKRLAVEKTALRIVAKVKGYGVETS